MPNYGKLTIRNCGIGLLIPQNSQSDFGDIDIENTLVGVNEYADERELKILIDFIKNHAKEACALKDEIKSCHTEEKKRSLITRSGFSQLLKDGVAISTIIDFVSKMVTK
ncbi:hypothetical protein ACOII5_004032 [Cronobacter dublinensis]